MKTEKQFMRRSRHWLLAGVVLMAGTVGPTSCSEYDLDEETPAGWGASIYSWLDDQGDYTNTVQIIRDLNYTNVLGKTGSKTLFVADDAAFGRFYANNTWGVRSYKDLTESQKKMLLFGNMLDNSMQLNSLSSVEGPIEGECMRRFASNSPYDSIMVLDSEHMPDNRYWKPYREAGKIVCMGDNSTVPLIHFVEKMLEMKRITNDDYNFLYNHTTDRKPGDASVNGVQVEQPNIKCSNGFIHRMAEVVTPLPNMAEIIARKENVSQFNSLLERFCAPYWVGEEMNVRYNDMYGTSDSLFQKRFFSQKSQKGENLNLTPANTPVSGQLLFDPEWNAYYAGNNDLGGNVAMERDMAVMMVPSNKAMDEYWNTGAGRVLKDYYGSWDNVPDNVVAKLINNNMLTSFISSVPSKFEDILNDANDPMGVTVESVDSVWLGCNGAVYLTDCVYSPTAYVSVSFPALINETMNILNWGIEQLQYNVYLNSLNSYYSFFLPTNHAMLEYIDPCSYGKNKTQLYRFHYDPTKPESDRVWAGIFNYDIETGEVLDSIGRASTDQVKNRLNDILNTHIVIGNVEDGKTYYRTKGGTEIRVNNVAAGVGGMTVEGSYQINEGRPLVVADIYDQTEKGNGKTYILDGAPIMGTRHTVRDVLASQEEYSAFLDLLDGTGLIEQIHLNRNACGGDNISTFNTYHYTVYVPTNESIRALQQQGKLPTWEQVEAWEEAGLTAEKTRDSLAIVDFVKYHLQDNALFIGATAESGDYETALINPETGRFHRLTSKLDENGIVIRDEAGNTRHVLISNERLYNRMAREYQYDGIDKTQAGRIETTSSAVVHLIDQPLLIKN
ncbi:hypothetical protein [Xylanibacter muris]|uniref:hypothetical protein n=2 Tax=Xylanibacter muris TaxID=2736290 RepID=UPI0025969A2C|nr:hypothetical protein [Xylanibacter muris]